jgi:hypothetical protein
LRAAPSVAASLPVPASAIALLFMSWVESSSPSAGLAAGSGRSAATEAQ